jgi:hypothetical protein
MTDASADTQSVGPIFEIASVEFLPVEKLGAVKAQTLQFLLQLCGIEEKLEGLSVPGHTFRKSAERLSLPGIQERRIDGEIEHHAASLWHSSDERQGGHTSFAREVGCDSQPGEKRRNAGIESRALQTIRKRLFFEIQGHKGQRCRNRNARAAKLLMLPRLRGRMVDLEHSQPGMRIAVRESVESCAKDDELCYAVRNGACEFILGVAAARRHEGSKSARKSRMLLRIGAQRGGRFRSNDGEGERIVENARMIEKLVRSPANGHALRSFAELAFLHIFESGRKTRLYKNV